MSPGPEQPPPLCADKHTPLCQHPASGRKGTLLSTVTRCFQTPRSTRRAQRAERRDGHIPGAQHAVMFCQLNDNF